MNAHPVLQREPGESKPRSRFVAKGAVSRVVEKYVVAPLREEQIHLAVVIRVAGANSLPPASVPDARFLGYIFKAKPAKIVIEVRSESR